MKTLEQWNNSGVNFEAFINPGDEIDSDLLHYFLGVVPPRIMKGYGFLVGEAASHNNKGQAVYDSFYTSPDNERCYYGGPKTVKEFTDSSDKKYPL